MDQPSFNQIVELLIRNERNLSEFRRSLSEVRQSLDTLTRKVDFLVDQSITRDQSGVFSRSGLHNDLLILTPSGRVLEPRGSRQ